jgi:RNA-binding protein NOB1
VEFRQRESATTAKRARERGIPNRKKNPCSPPPCKTSKNLPPPKKKPSKVLAFARETGELHSISSTDARLIALARGLERAAGREARLRLGPPPPRAVRRGGPRARPPPGWGASGGDWAPLDALEEAEERLARASGVGERRGEEEEGEGEEAAAAAPPTPEQSKAAGEGASGDAGGDDESGDDESGDDESGDESGDDGWTTAAKSTAAQRRSKRTAARKAAREEVAAAAAAAATAPAAEGEEEGWETASDDDGDDSGSGSDDGERAAPSAAAAGTHDELDDDPAADSPISLVTSDFAMQNVALQMGLRVVASDAGSRIREARRWALRCSACSFCSREAGRLFCPRCGNAALDKVEVVVGASGAAAFGVRRSHCLRGTKFSLPKPRGGRGGSGPILREDQLLEAMARARRSNRGRKGARAAAAAAAGDDPLLAPELATADAWFKAAGGENGGLSATAALGGATAALVAAAWKHNPNEARRWGGGVRASGSAGKRK